MGEFVEVEGLRLHYVSKGSGYPLVLLHGAGADLEYYLLSIFDRLSEDFQVLAFDRPGHGLSERPSEEMATPSVQARLIHKGLEQLGIKKAILLGHSWSGALILAYVLHYPDDVSGIISVSGYVWPEKSVRMLLAGLANRLANIPLLGDISVNMVMRLVKLFLKPILKVMLLPSGSMPEDFLSYSEKIVAAFLQSANYVKSTIEDVVLLDPDLEKLIADYSKINIPVTIITSDSDNLVPPKNHSYKLHRIIAHSNLLILENAGHLPPDIYPDEVIGAVKQMADSIQNKAV